jgi:hypothetical protein
MKRFINLLFGVFVGGFFIKASGVLCTSLDMVRQDINTTSYRATKAPTEEIREFDSMIYSQILQYMNKEDVISMINGTSDAKKLIKYSRSITIILESTEANQSKMWNEIYFIVLRKIIATGGCGTFSTSAQIGNKEDIKFLKSLDAYYDFSDFASKADSIMYKEVRDLSLKISAAIVTLFRDFRLIGPGLSDLVSRLNWFGRKKRISQYFMKGKFSPCKVFESQNALITEDIAELAKRFEIHEQDFEDEHVIGALYKGDSNFFDYIAKKYNLETTYQNQDDIPRAIILNASSDNIPDIFQNEHWIHFVVMDHYKKALSTITNLERKVYTTITGIKEVAEDIMIPNNQNVWISNLTAQTAHFIGVFLSPQRLETLNMKNASIYGLKRDGFYGSNKLSKIAFSPDLRFLGNNALKEIREEVLDLRETKCEVIDHFAFNSLFSRVVYLPKSVKKLLGHAFSYCPYLKKVSNDGEETVRFYWDTFYGCCIDELELGDKSSIYIPPPLLDVVKLSGPFKKYSQNSFV